MTTETAPFQAVQVDAVVSCGGPYFDKNGNQLREFDVVKVFHFIGARRKRHYMYKWIRKDSNGLLCMKHLDDDVSSLVRLPAVSKKQDGRWVWGNAEIVQTSYS